MTGAGKARVNRANGRASMGPKTAAGKRRSAGNALRHGLSVALAADPALGAEVETAARAIAGVGADVQGHALARRIAEAQIDLARVRRARLDLFAQTRGNPNDPPLAGLLASTPPPNEAISAPRSTPEGAQNFAVVLSALGKELAVMDRYERRALSRRKFAIRALDAHRLVAASDEARHAEAAAGNGGRRFGRTNPVTNP
jgi:hypothetical protein